MANRPLSISTSHSTNQLVRSARNGIIFLTFAAKIISMRDWLRTLIAGYGAYKWGGGCVGTILVFIIIYWLLGHC